MGTVGTGGSWNHLEQSWSPGWDTRGGNRANAGGFEGASFPHHRASETPSCALKLQLITEPICINYKERGKCLQSLSSALAAGAPPAALGGTKGQPGGPGSRTELGWEQERSVLLKRGVGDTPVPRGK